MNIENTFLDTFMEKCRNKVLTMEEFNQYYNKFITYIVVYSNQNIEHCIIELLLLKVNRSCKEENIIYWNNYRNLLKFYQNLQKKKIMEYKENEILESYLKAIKKKLLFFSITFEEYISIGEVFNILQKDISEISFLKRLLFQARVTLNNENEKHFYQNFQNVLKNS